MNTLRLITNVIINMHKHTDLDDATIARVLTDTLDVQFGYTTATNMINGAFNDERIEKAKAFHAQKEIHP